MRLRWLLPLLAVSVAACSGAKGSGFGNGSGDGGDPFQDPDSGGFKSGEGGTTGGGCNPDPGNFDIPGNNCDDDGDGTVDNPPNCDTGLSMTGPAADFAKAIGLCKTSSGGSWGVVSATYTQGYKSNKAPDANQHGILTKFGTKIKPRQGSALGALSSGYARDKDNCSTNFGDPGAFKGGCEMTGGGAAPPGFPKDSPSCPQGQISQTVNDVADLKLVVKVPNNAKGFSFDFDFWSGEWPEFVCTEFNDSFIAYLTSKAFNGGAADNISFDSNKNPVSVNNGFFDRCSPGSGLGCGNFPANYKYCGSGNSELQGTGFYDPGDHCFSGNNDSGGGATGWLTTSAPVQQGETITLEFMVWDTGDQNLRLHRPARQLAVAGRRHRRGHRPPAELRRSFLPKTTRGESP